VARRTEPASGLIFPPSRAARASLRGLSRRRRLRRLTKEHEAALTPKKTATGRHRRPTAMARHWTRIAAWVLSDAGPVSRHHRAGPRRGPESRSSWASCLLRESRRDLRDKPRSDARGARAIPRRAGTAGRRQGRRPRRTQLLLDVGRLRQLAPTLGDPGVGLRHQLSGNLGQDAVGDLLLGQ
jgi:hypothetical protein